MRVLDDHFNPFSLSWLSAVKTLDLPSTTAWSWVQLGFPSAACCVLTSPPPSGLHSRLNPALANLNPLRETQPSFHSLPLNTFPGQSPACQPCWEHPTSILRETVGDRSMHNRVKRSGIRQRQKSLQPDSWKRKHKSFWSLWLIWLISNEKWIKMLLNVTH